MTTEIFNASFETCEKLGVVSLSDLPDRKDYGAFKDFVCIDHFLILVFAKAAVFYSWRTKEILQLEKVCTGVLDLFLVSG